MSQHDEAMKAHRRDRIIAFFLSGRWRRIPWPWATDLWQSRGKTRRTLWDFLDGDGR